jgi:hypothetical protein
VHQAQRGHRAPGHVTSSATKVSPQLLAGTKPFFEVDETILKPKTFIWGAGQRQAFKVCSMIELVIVVIALFSAGIFVAHAVDAYQAH